MQGKEHEGMIGPGSHGLSTASGADDPATTMSNQRKRRKTDGTISTDASDAGDNHRNVAGGEARSWGDGGSNLSKEET